jgi:hypothetical protein
MVINNNLQNTTQKNADRATRTPLKTGSSGRVAVWLQVKRRPGGSYHVQGGHDIDDGMYKQSKPSTITS